MKLKNKTAIVTGGASGIGKAVVFDFLDEGANVVIADRDDEKGSNVLEEIKKEYGQDRAIFLKTDVSKLPAVENMVRKTIESFKEINILVNVAGTVINLDVVDMSEAEWDIVININLKGHFFCCKEVSKAMIKQGKGGKIINTSSIHAKISMPGCAAYCVSKAGIEALSRNLATELARYNVNVNCVAPGATITPLTVPLYTESVIKALKERITLGKIALPGFIAPCYTFLASAGSDYITGQIITADGGYIMDGSLPAAKYWEE